jgi:phosphatidylinositol 3-kinase
MLYLLQLVQALKYENFDMMKESDDEENKDLKTVPSSLPAITREQEFAENSTSSSISGYGRPISPVGNLAEASARGHSSSDASLASNLSAIVGAMASEVNSLAINKTIEESAINLEKPDLATFLIHRACENTTLANYFYWYGFIIY